MHDIYFVKEILMLGIILDVKCQTHVFVLGSQYEAPQHYLAVYTPLGLDTLSFLLLVVWY